MEQAELDQLQRRYPGMPLKDYNPFCESLRASDEWDPGPAAGGRQDVADFGERRGRLRRRGPRTPRSSGGDGPTGAQGQFQNGL
jgi:hypothetical protein